MLVGRAVVEIHFGEGVVDFYENVAELRVIDILGDNRQDRAQLLVFLLKSQLLVHVCDALLKSGLER